MAEKMTQESPASAEDEPSSAASQLSALVDGELADREIGLVLRRLLREQDAKTRWERFHLIGDVMQGHLPDAFDPGFAARIRQVIEAEPPLRSAVKPLSTWYKPVTGFGLAASVVLVGLFGLQLTQTGPTSSALLASQPPASAGPPARVASLMLPAKPDNLPAGKNGGPVDARLNNYLVNHNNYASLNGMHGMLPYVRMVGYQADR